MEEQLHTELILIARSSSDCFLTTPPSKKNFEKYDMPALLRAFAKEGRQKI